MQLFTWIKENILILFIGMFYLVMLTVCLIVIWEAFTGKSIVDKIWNWFNN